MFSHAARFRQLVFRIDATILNPLSLISAKEKAHSIVGSDVNEVIVTSVRAPIYSRRMLPVGTL